MNNPDDFGEEAKGIDVKCMTVEMSDGTFEVHTQIENIPSVELADALADAIKVAFMESLHRVFGPGKFVSTSGPVGKPN